jgi:predicted dehydrogenase
MGGDLRRWVLLTAMPALAMRVALGVGPEGGPGATVRLITLDPGHFHAALIQKDMYPGVSDTVHVYAPLGPDLIAHLSRISQFNQRSENPTRWRVEIHTGPDFLEKMLKERPGNVVVLSGRNQGKIDRILACLNAGLNVLADKPWIIAAANLPRLEAALATAEAKGLVAYDVMTERYEITTILQKELLADPTLSGGIVSGTELEPGVFMESVHHLMKTVAGVPNLRPAWFFDTSEQGEALADVGTHLVDLVPWMLFPEEPLDYRRDIRIISARGWPTVLTRAAFERVTGERGFPPILAPWLRGDELQYGANTLVSYTLRGVHVQLRARWNYEAPEGAGDTHLAVIRGSRARLEVRQGPEQRYRTELYVVPASPADEEAVRAALEKRLAQLRTRFPGLASEDQGSEIRVVVPDGLRSSHESHFAQVTARFLGYLKDPRSVPAWEKANMLAKYYVTTGATELSHSAPR